MTTKYVLFKRNRRTILQVVKKWLWIEKVYEYQKFTDNAWFDVTNDKMLQLRDSNRLTRIQKSVNKNKH